MYNYALAGSLDDALSLLAGKEHRILAGGTDFYPAQGEKPFSGSVLDISGLKELQGIREEEDFWRLGALATWSDIADADLPPVFRGLQLAAQEVGALQIQNAGTIAGNLCNASPAADGVPPLLTLNAEIELTSTDGVRRLSLGDFVQGNRVTARNADELVTAVLIPKGAEDARSHFIKLGSRRYLVISLVMASAVIEATADGRVASARVAVGSCSIVARRLAALEADLVGLTLSPELAEVVRTEHLAPLSPIDDVRASAGYRLEAAEELVRRVLAECGREERQR